MYQLSKDGLLTNEEIDILRKLYDIMSFDADFLSNEGYIALNLLQDRADELNGEFFNK